MKVHELKLHEQFELAVWSGNKQFEIRKNDRDYQIGDRIEFTVVDNDGNQQPSLLDGRQYLITYVLSGWGLQPGWVALGIREVKRLEVT